jgi:hypothetical protein
VGENRLLITPNSRLKWRALDTGRLDATHQLVGCRFPDDIAIFVVRRDDGEIAELLRLVHRQTNQEVRAARRHHAERLEMAQQMIDNLTLVNHGELDRAECTQHSVKLVAALMNVKWRSLSPVHLERSHGMATDPHRKVYTRLPHPHLRLNERDMLLPRTVDESFNRRKICVLHCCTPVSVEGLIAKFNTRVKILRRQFKQTPEKSRS